MEPTFQVTVLEALEQELDPSHIQKRVQSGRTFRYIEAHEAIKTANRIFGYGNWQYKIVNLAREVYQGTDRNGKPVDKITFLAWVELCVQTGHGPCIISDIGTGTAEYLNSGEIDKATKGAISDGLKRCLRVFGNQFGLGLYDKETAEVEAPATRRPKDEGFGEPDVPASLDPPTDELDDYRCEVDDCDSFCKGYSKADGTVVTAAEQRERCLKYSKRVLCPKHYMDEVDAARKRRVK